MTGDKFRFRFSKSGTLRLVSHHDLMRCAERMLRRAAVPFKSTAGFHPTPRLVFALSLPLGVVGCDEVVELELTEPRDGNELLAALNAQAPTGMVLTRVAPVPMKVTAQARRVVYEVPLPPDRVAQTEAAVTAFLAESKVWVERLRPSPKRLNLRPYVRAISVANPERQRRGESQQHPVADAPGSPEHAAILRLDLWVTQTGTARAEELLDLLGLPDLIDDGAVLSRTTVELRDEITATDPADVPPDGPADAVSLTGPEVAALTARLKDDENQQPAEAGWGASPNGPVVE